MATVRIGVLLDRPVSTEETPRFCTPKGADWRKYKNSGLQIWAYFHDGINDSLTYSKDLSDTMAKQEGISFEEIAVLLDNNSRGADDVTSVI